MIPSILFGDTQIADYCATTCLIRQGLADKCWDRCKSVRSCCNKNCDCGTSLTGCETECPCIEEMWWYDPRNACSRDFLGIIVTDKEVSAAYSRETKQTQKGGRHKPLQMLPIEIKIEFYIVSCSEEGTDYGIDILSQLGAHQVCFDDCVLPQLKFVNTCKDCDREVEDERQEFIQSIEDLVPEGYEIVDTTCVTPRITGQNIVTVALADLCGGDLDKITDTYPLELECGCPCVPDPEAFQAALDAGDLSATVQIFQDEYEVSGTELIDTPVAIQLWSDNFEEQFPGELDNLVPEGYEIIDIECDTIVTDEVPCSNVGSPGEIVANSCCPTCDNTVIYRNVLPKGPVIEKEPVLGKRCCGVKAEWTFTAEIPYKFFGKCGTTDVKLFDKTLYPNWCTPTPENCAELSCVDSGVPSGEEGRGLLGVRPSGGTGCYCHPVFVNAVSSPVLGRERFPTFVSWELEAAEDLQNVSVCFYEDLGTDPLEDPELYSCDPPIVSTIGNLEAGVVYRGDSEVCAGFEGGTPAGANFNFGAIRQDCMRGWLVVKSDACNGSANSSLDISIELSQGSL